MAKPKRKPGRPKGSKTKVRRTRPAKQGIFFTNPHVAAQIGSALGATLATMYAEDPKILEKAVDSALPGIVQFGRDFEREDILAALHGKRRKKGMTLKEFVTFVSSGKHVRELDLKEIKRRLAAQMDFYTASMKNDFQEGLKGN